MANESSSKPMYEHIYETLRARIANGSYQIGERVPSEKELGEEFGVSRITSKKALELLAAAGYIVRQPGRGSFVSETLPLTQSSAEIYAGSAAHTTTAIGQPEKGRKRTIGLVITNFSFNYGTEIVYGMEEASREHNSFLVLRRSLGNAELEERMIRQLMDAQVDGLIIFPTQGEFFSAEILKLVIQKFPFVLIDRYLKGIPAPSVSTDNVEAARIGAKHLFDLGHQHIAFLTPPPANTTAIEERIEGIIDAHADYNLVVNRDSWLETITSTIPNVNDPEVREHDTQAIADHLRKHPHITALFASEYLVAVIAVAAVQRIGLRVPEDISIICFDGPDTHEDGYRFTHIRQDQYQMGKQSYEIVLQMLEAKEPPIQRVLLPAQLVVGKTTVAPPSRTI